MNKKLLMLSALLASAQMFGAQSPKFTNLFSEPIYIRVIKDGKSQHANFVTDSAGQKPAINGWLEIGPGVKGPLGKIVGPIRYAKADMEIKPLFVLQIATSPDPKKIRATYQFKEGPKTINATIYWLKDYNNFHVRFSSKSDTDKYIVPLTDFYFESDKPSSPDKPRSSDPSSKKLVDTNLDRSLLKEHADAVKILVEDRKGRSLTTLFDLFEVESKNPSKSEMKTAYRKLTIKWHPDKEKVKPEFKRDRHDEEKTPFEKVFNFINELRNGETYRVTYFDEK